MKKIYMQPTVVAFKIEMPTVLSNSIPTDDDTTPTPGTTLSREFDYDEDYEDEEEY